MTKLSKFLQASPVLAAVLIGAGLHAYSNHHSQDTDPAWQHIAGPGPTLDWSDAHNPRVVVYDEKDVEATKERMADALNKASTDVAAIVKDSAVNRSPEKDIEAAKNVGWAIADVLEHTRNPEQSMSDWFLLTYLKGIKTPPDMQQLLEVVNNQKIQLFQMNKVLKSLGQAYEAHDTEEIQNLTVKYEQISKGVHKQLTSDLDAQADTEIPAYRG